MPIQYSIEPEQRLVTMTATGRISLETMLEYYGRLRSDPAFRPEYDQLADFRDSTPDGLMSNEVRIVLDSSPYGPGSRRAYIVSPGLSFGMARMTGMIAAERRLVTREFLSEAEARRWLRGE